MRQPRRSVTRPASPFSLALSPIAGVLAALGQEPYALPLALLAGLGLLFALNRQSPSRGTSGRSGLLFALGYFGFTLSWLIHPFQVDAATHGWLAPIALFLLVAGLALLWALAFWLAHTLTPQPDWRPASTALLLTGTEMLREHLFTGFPWALPGYTWTDQPIGQAASLVGVHGLTAITLTVAALPFTGRRRGPRIILALAILAGLHGMGLLRLHLSPADPGVGLPLRLVQPNIPQPEKWPTAFATRNRDTLFALSLQPAAEDPVLILWPETAITWRRLDPTANLTGDDDSLPHGRQVLAGIIRQDDRSVYNTAVIRRPAAPIAFVDKSRLVPFGEYVPFASLMARFGLGPLASGDTAGFARGSGPGLLAIDGIGRVRVLICYEAIFPGLARQGPRPAALVQITNDAWFGLHSGPHQHLAHSRMRSLELGLPLVRVANTGISAVIDSSGRIIAKLPLGETGIIDAPLPPPRPETLYARTGDAPLLTTMLLLLLLQTAHRVRNMAGPKRGPFHRASPGPARIGKADC